MGLMMTRLANLESRVQFQAKEIAEKDKKIRILEEKISLLNRTRDSGDLESDMKLQLEKRCLLLQQQVHEMEAFLADYGMIWVGEESDPDTNVYTQEGLEEISEAWPGPERGSTWVPEESVARAFQVDFNLVVKNIAELNALAGEGVGHVTKTSDGARIKTRMAVPLVLYANGLVMFSGPFRPYTDVETRRCVQDIMDGYFPSELQARYPDGIPLNVVDKRSVQFLDKRAAVFQGEGQTLGGETRPSRLVPSNLHHPQPASPGAQAWRGAQPQKSAQTAAERPNSEVREALDVESELPEFATGRKLTLEQFLNRVPQSVVKQGRVIDVRQSLHDTLKGGATQQSDVTVIETEAVIAMKQRLEVSPDKRPPSARDLSTLRIKSERGDHTYVLKMRFTDTIADVKRHLDTVRPAEAGPYHLMSAFPRKSYEDLSATLLSCGLVPNAALHMKPG